MSTESGAVTALLERIRQGSEEAKNELITLLLDQFRQRAHQRLRHERPGHSLATTDLTDEALLRLLKNDEFAKAANENQLYRAFARAMRQVLIDHARRRNADKRGGGWHREELDDLAEDVRGLSQIDVLSLHEALDALAADFPRGAAVLEMRFFGGFTMAEIAEALSAEFGRVSLSTVENDYRHGLAWLHNYLSPEDGL
jgi:RNA polymerase sigma factor (TIGR02999 family)